MRDEEMKEGWGTCPRCKENYYATEMKFPNTDISHDICCPSCGATVGWVSKGTDDFSLQSEESIKKHQQEESQKPNCPLCGRKMVKRKGSSEFWGCSKFPKCKGTRQINEEEDEY